jgi:hypothetical protein
MSFDLPLPAPNLDRVFPTVQSGFVDEVLEVIVSDAPDILERANSKPAQPAKPLPAHATIGDLIERGNPVPVSQSPPPKLSQARVIQIEDLVATAELVRKYMARGIVMLDGVGRPISATDIFGVPRSVVTANFRQAFSFAEGIVGIGIPIGDLVTIEGPRICHDVFSRDLMPETATYATSKDSDSVVRLLRPTMPVPRTRAIWRNWTIASDVDILPLNGGELRLPKDATSPFGQLPALFQDRLLNPTPGENG